LGPAPLRRRSKSPLTISPSPELVPVALPARLVYSVQNVIGAMSRPFLCKPVAEALLNADRFVREQSGGSVGILVWDAYRVRICQQAIWNNEAARLRRENPSWLEEKVQKEVAEFVSPPEKIFRHGTGGAVDVTLIENGNEVLMGTKYDEFVPRAALDYFRRNPPVTLEDKVADSHREFLREAMEISGFVGLEREWWHYELGTEMWGKARNEQSFLNSVLPPPSSSEAPAMVRQVFRAMPSLESGVAQAFDSATTRDEALAGIKPAHYYARTSTASRDALETTITNTFSSAGCLVTTNGLAACLVAMRALVPFGGHIILADTIYYEVALRMFREVAYRHWTLHPVDIESPIAVSTMVSRFKGNFVLWCDQPSNWWLGTADIGDLAHLVHHAGGLLVVDSSVQPLAPVLKQGADVAVFSLSKYPSCGLTMGGALVSNSTSLNEALRNQRANDAVQLSSESAYRISESWSGLPDRIVAVSQKARAIIKYAERIPSVKRILKPSEKLLGTRNIGGQITFELMNAEDGATAEKIIEHNFHRQAFPLTLMTTFGAIRTTFENFHPRGPANDDVVGRYVRPLPATLCRLGIGHESLADLQAALSLALENVRINY
jgi:cystathionine beta-lyase/cystathionine gamma-synthase/D-alanyl-D-alanine dipeptidase